MSKTEEFAAEVLDKAVREDMEGVLDIGHKYGLTRVVREHNWILSESGEAVVREWKMLVRERRIAQLKAELSKLESER